MASKIHQKISGLIIRKMRQKRYEIVSFDGREKIVEDINLRIPPTVVRHRPDIIGINLANGKLCIGEAKTAADLATIRTQEQFLDFSKVITKEGDSVELIIGIPQSGEADLIALLKKLNLSSKPNVSYVWIPDNLLDEEKDDLDEERI